MSMIPTKLTDRDAEFAALLGHKQTESTWKPTLFLIARFREESERLALQEMREEIQQARDMVARAVLAKAEESAAPAKTSASGVYIHKLDDSVIWAMFVAARASTRPKGDAIDDANTLLNDYINRFPNG